KNFAEPLRALDEMHRVLRAGGTAIIEDLNRDASNAEIDQGVRGQRLSGFNAFLTRFVLRTMLRRRAYTPAQLRDLVRESAFRTGDIRTQGIGVEVRLKKSFFSSYPLSPYLLFFPTRRSSALQVLDN